MSGEPFVLALDQGAAALDWAGLLAGRGAASLIEVLRQLEAARSSSSSLYRRVRACAYATALARFRLQADPALAHLPPVPERAWRARLEGRLDEALAVLWTAAGRDGFGRMLAAEFAAAYRAALFADLAHQVQRSVRANRGNRWLFRCGSLQEYPLRLHPGLWSGIATEEPYPILAESTPVRLDLTHSGWSDIFFLAMDRPDLARVINASVALAVGRPGAAPDTAARPPITTCVRVIDEPVLRLTAVDLGETRDLGRLDEVFDFAADHLSLLRAAVVASGVVPPALEGTCQSLAQLLEILVGPGLGLEVVSHVLDIPRGSRLAVSTNLLASLVAVLMRATGQTASLEGPLGESERRIVASRAILGEWLGGSGGGWQDSGGIWPGFKAIEGVAAGPDDPEFGQSTGCLLPRHRLIDLDDPARDRIMSSLVVFHGGMAGNVGPVLELVTEAHLVGWDDARAARAELTAAFPAIERALVAGDAKTLGTLTHGLFTGPLPAIIPSVDNAFTSAVIDVARAEFGAGFWGFGMLGGMSGGGMSMWVDPAIRHRVEARFPGILADLADLHRASMPFVITPVLMRAELNREGTVARLKRGDGACMPAAYYRLQAPLLARLRHDGLSPRRRADLLLHLDRSDAGVAEHSDMLRTLVVHLLPDPVAHGGGAEDERLTGTKAGYGFDPERQTVLQAQYRSGLIGLTRNQLPLSAHITEVAADAVIDAEPGSATLLAEAQRLIAAGAVAEVILAGGVGSRWSGGAGVVKALSPFVRLRGAWRSFLELHLRRHQREGAHPLLITASFLTEEPIRRWLGDLQASDPALVAEVRVSSGRGVCQRMVPTQADLATWFTRTSRSRLDPQAEKQRQALDRAWLAWAGSQGGATPYADRDPVQVLNPPGHWWELPSALLNGELARLLAARPQVSQLCLHNVDVLGAGVDAGLLARHLAGGGVLSAEVLPRLTGDAGGSLAVVDGRLRIVEGLAMPDPGQELGLRWYNSNTWWIDLDRWLGVLGLSRSDLGDPARVAEAVRRTALRLPVYLTVKLVKRRWGHGHEDQLPVAQAEQLWSDFSVLPECACRYLAIPRQRGQQLKDIGQVPDWIRDGSCAEVAVAAGLS